MSTGDEETSGPAMLVITRAARPGPIMVSEPIRGFQLPRAVKMSSVAIAFGGVLAGILFYSVIPFAGRGLTGVMISALLFAVFAVTIANWSPLPGTSFAAWARLSSRTASSRITVNGSTQRICVANVDVPPPSGGVIVARTHDHIAWATSTMMPDSQLGAAHIGCRPLTTIASGPTRIVGASARISPHTFDEHGVPRTTANRNLEHHLRPEDYL